MAKVQDIIFPELPTFSRGDHAELAQHLAGMIVEYAEKRAKQLGRELLPRHMRFTAPEPQNPNPCDAEWHSFEVEGHQKEVVSFLLQVDDRDKYPIKEVVITKDVAMAMAMRFSTRYAVYGKANHTRTIDYRDAEGIVLLARAYLLHGRPFLGATFEDDPPKPKDPP